jgi:arylsulfatase A-like enzyme
MKALFKSKRRRDAPLSGESNRNYRGVLGLHKLGVPLMRGLFLLVAVGGGDLFAQFSGVNTPYFGGILQADETVFAPLPIADRPDQKNFPRIYPNWGECITQSKGTTGDADCYCSTPAIEESSSRPLGQQPPPASKEPRTGQPASVWKHLAQQTTLTVWGERLTEQPPLASKEPHTGASPSTSKQPLAEQTAPGSEQPVAGQPTPASPERPNILWITCEDMGPNLGCYGDAYAQTPHLDRLAEQGLRYRVCWSNAPVCAPARTAIITGVYPTSLGAEHMRSQVRMPEWMKMYPQFLRQQGYYCTNNSKEDYNLTKPPGVWDESSPKAHWKNRAPGQPFFAIFNLTITHESQIRNRPHTLQHDPAKAPVPPYHPDTPEVRHDWAQYYDRISQMDAQAGQILQELEEAGLADQTIVFFYSDHGSGMPRHKRWLYEGGLHVPLIVYFPPKFRHLAPKEYRPGGVSDRMVSFVDLAPTLLSLVGIRPPDWMQGRAFMGPFAGPEHKYLFGFRGRMDERYDMSRAVRNQRYLYIRNYMPHRLQGEYVGYMFQTPTTVVWRKLFDEGKLRPEQAAFWQPKPPEELYDLQTDPYCIRNLAEDPNHAAVLEELRQALRHHILEVRDLGFLSEAEMHRRARDRAPYEFGHDPKAYPLERILAMAELAAQRTPEAVPRLREGLRDSDSGVRYWAAMGLLIRGQEAVRAARTDLLQALQDESPSVRVTAAWALGLHGPPEDLDQVLQTLQAHASPQTNGTYLATYTLNIIDALGKKAEPIYPALRQLPLKDPNAPARANDYVERLLPVILGPDWQPPQPKPKAKSARPKPKLSETIRP